MNIVLSNHEIFPWHRIGNLSYRGNLDQFDGQEALLKDLSKVDNYELFFKTISTIKGSFAVILEIGGVARYILQ